MKEVNRQQLIAVRPSDKILIKGESSKYLRRKLFAKYNIEIPSDKLCKYNVRTTSCGKINYWFYKGIIIVLEKDYSPSNIENIFIDRLKPNKSFGVLKPRKISDSLKAKILEAVKLRNVDKIQVKEIAEIVGMSRTSVSHILNGRIHSSITGIKHKRKYNSYDSDGSVLIKKEVMSTKVYK